MVGDSDALPVLDRHHLKLLALFSDRTFEFTRTYVQQDRAMDLRRHGFLEGRMEVYSIKAGGRSQQWRWAFRRTPAGTERLKLPVSETPGESNGGDR